MAASSSICCVPVCKTDWLFVRAISIAKYSASSDANIDKALFIQAPLAIVAQ
jgi:hypothetical protein